MPITVTTDLPDAQQPTLNNGVEDEIGVVYDDVLNYGSYEIQLRETDSSEWSDGQSQTVGEKTTNVAFAGLEDGEEYEVRVRTSTEHVTGDWTTAVSIVTVFPSPTGFSLDSTRFDSLTFSFTDRADNEQEIRLERRVDGGSWETADTYDPNTTTVTDDSPPYFRTVEYRVFATTPHATGVSNTVAVIPANSDASVWAELEGDDATEPIAPRRIASANIDLTHTAISGWEIRLSPVLDGIRDYHLDEAQIWVGDERLIRGEVLRTPEDSEGITIVGDGPVAKLQEDTERATYSGRAWKAIEDYAEKTPADSWTVHPPYVRSQGTDENFIDAPTFDDLDELLLEPPADYPLYYSRTEVRPAQCAWALEAEAASSTYTEVSEGHQGGAFSNAAGVEMDFGGDITFTFTNEYTIPADDIDLAFRASVSGFSGEYVVRIDGDEVYRSPTYSDYSSNVAYRGGVTDAPSSDLKPGEHTVSIDLQIGSTSGTGDVRVDHVAIWDNLSRYMGYIPTLDSTVDTEFNTLSGPELYPNGVEATFRANAFWHVSKARAELEISDTSGSQAIGLSNNGSDYVTASNTTSHTVDFDSAGYYGDDALVRVTLGRYTAYDETVTPDQGDAAQTITDLKLYLDTDDLPLVDGFEANADSWLANMQDLHEAADMRFTVDHRSDGLHIESYRRGDPDVLQPDDWTTDGLNAVSYERDTSEYWNEATIYPDPNSRLSSRTIRDSADADRVGAIKPRSRTSSITDDDELTRETRSFLLEGIAGDQISGSIQIVPTYIKPGYPYQPSEFDGQQANLESVSISLSNGSISGSLSFGARRDLVAALSQGGQ